MSSHAVKYWVEHKSDVDGNERTYRIELLEEGFGGSSTEKVGYADTGVFRLNFERLSRDQIFEGIAQKGRLELDLAIQNASDLAILTDIVAGDENKYKLRLKVDGSVKWTGFVIPDLIQYPEGDYPHPGTITAKDLSLIEAEDFETNTAISYEIYMSVIADLVNSTGLDLNVHSYNDWTTGEITSTDDYFNQAYIDKYHLQNFSSFNEGSFEARNKLDVLKEIIPPGFILRQYDNVWNLFSVDYLAKSGGTVKRYEYNTSGTKTGSTSSIDLTEDVDRVDNYIEGTSQNKPWRGLKQLRVEFNHKTSIQNILFDDEYIVSADSANEYGKETLKVSDTTQRRIKLSGQVEVTTDTNPGSTRLGEVYLIIQVGDYEIDLSDGSWDQNHGEETVSVSGSDTTLTGTFSEPLSDNIPNVIGEDTLTIELRWGSVTGETVQQVRWHNLSLSLINGEDIDDGASKFYRLTQSGTYSSKKDITPIIFGQGPTDLSNSALRYFSGSAVFEMLTGFRHVGDGSGDQYEEFVLTNLMNLQRGVISSLNADLRALYNPRNLLVHNSKNYLFLDGQLSGKDSLWNGTIVELNWQTGTDTFSEFFKIGDGDAGNTIAVSSGSGSSQGELDNRYFKQSNNLSEGDAATMLSNLGVTATAAELNRLDGSLATVRSNLGLTDQTADLDLNSISINGTNLFPDNDPQTLGTGDSVTHLNGTFTGDLRGDTLRTDTGKFFAPTSFAFRNAGDTGYRNIELAQANLFASSANENLFRLSHPSSPTSAGYEIGFSSINSTDNRGITHYVEYADTIYDVFRIDRETRDIAFLEGDLETDNFSDWFSASPAGWQVKYDGTADFRAVFADELFAKAFTVDVAQALAGSDFLTKSVAQLADSFTVPSVGNTVTITLEDLEGLSGYQVFEANDWVRFRVVDRSGGGLSIYDVYGQVTSYSDNADDTQDWTYTVDYAGASNAAVGMEVYEGAIALDYGTSGDTYIERTVLNRSSGTDFSKTPYDRIVRWTGSDPRTGSKEVLTQIGNLNGLVSGYDSTTFGGFFTDTVFIGDDTKSGDFLEFKDGSMDINAENYSLASEISFGTGSKYLFLQTEEVFSEQSRQGRGFTLYTDNDALSDGSVKAVRIGQLTDEDTVQTFPASSNIGFQLQIVKDPTGTPTYHDVFRADKSSVKFFDFTANEESLFKVQNSVEVSMGSAQQWTSSVLGFQAGTDVNNRIWMGEFSGDYQLQVRDSGNKLISVGSLENIISGAYFDADHIWGGSSSKSSAKWQLGADGLKFSPPSSWSSSDASVITWEGTSSNSTLGCYGQTNPRLRLQANQIEFYDGDSNQVLNQRMTSTTESILELAYFDMLIDSSRLPKSRTAAGFTDRIYLIDQTDYYEIRIRK